MAHFFNPLVPVAFALAAALVTPAAQAGIVFSPASIVASQDGTYITDTINNRDWYRFDNTYSTVGLSMNAVSALIAGSGWSVATLAQVHILQGQFGWSSDTATNHTNANFGLTSAMGAYLGFTTSYLVPGEPFPETGQIIQAMTQEHAYIQEADDWHDYYNTTLSRTSAFVGANFFFGDYVNGSYGMQDAGVGISGIGTWLSREHVPAVGGGGNADPECGRLAPCTNDVPEPASYALVILALLGLKATKRSRARI